MSEKISVLVNDQKQAVEQGTSLDKLMEKLKYDQRSGIAVAINDTVIARSHWKNQKLQDQDQVLVVTATQGG